ncbi:MAG: COP23 domain-containing protein [Cyanobacteria bacterium]|nr:COP23 domain-containing protein [Cyanobacteriota bacterium]MDW8201268.1 COP23 domain-containing protein [Cyanobacteriota bacterium SKYGB_h_bin112]
MRSHLSKLQCSGVQYGGLVGLAVLGCGLGGLVGFTASSLAQQLPANRVQLSTTFYCTKADGSFATVARRGDRTTPPMITWRDTSFGPQFTPERRCQIVSERLTRAVAQNGGRLSNLRLTYGPLNGFPVICYVSSPEEFCSSDNLLITLRQDDRGREGQILQQILTFSIQGQGAPLTRGGTASRPEPIAFGAEVERALSSYSITPGILPPSIGNFRQEAQRSFGTGAIPVIPQSSTSPRGTATTSSTNPI